MAVNEYVKALPRILVYEGGKVDDPKDPGGRTDKGVTQVVYNTFRTREGLPRQDVYLISNKEVATIYKTLYWDRIKGDILPVGVAFCVFDAAVNSGVAQAAKWLQRALGPSYTGAIDGDFGPKTLQAVADDDDNDSLIQRMCARRLGSLKLLRTFPRFGKGWAARIANVQKIGQAWATGSIGPNPVDVFLVGGHTKATITDTVQPAISANQAHAASGGSAALGVLTQLTDAITPYKDAHIYVTYGFVGLTVAGIGLGAWATYKVSEAQKARDGAKAVYVDENADDGVPPIILNEDGNPPAPNPVTALPHPPAPIPTPVGTGQDSSTINIAKTEDGTTKDPG